MIKTLTLVGGLCGAAALSQAPAFSQQYLQRLAGQVDALGTVAMDFDRSALEAGFGREEALQQMTGSDFLVARQADMRGTFARHARLADNLTVLREASPLARLALPHRFADPATLTSTWSDFSPAMPLTIAGAVAAGTGGLLGWLSVAWLLAGLRALYRKLRKPSATPLTARREPVLQAAPTNTKHPTLAGEIR